MNWPRMTWWAASLLLAASCSDDPPQPRTVASATPAPQPTASAATIPAEPDRPSFPDPYAADLLKANDLIRDYGGDGRVLQQARESVMSILGKNREYAPAYASLAAIEYKAGYLGGTRYDPDALARASKFAAHALKLDPNLFEAHYANAMIARYRGDVDASRASLDIAEGLRPDDPRVKLARAGLAEAESNPKEMLRFAREVIEQSKDKRDLAAAYQYVVSAYAGGGHLDQADAAYRELLKVSPDSAWAHGNYARFLLRRDDLDGAIREGERALALMRYPAAMATLAEAYVRKADQMWNAGRVDEASMYVARVASLSGDDPIIAMSLGSYYERAYRRADDKQYRDRAVEAYRRALQLDPNNRQAAKNIARLTQ